MLWSKGCAGIALPICVSNFMSRATQLGRLHFSAEELLLYPWCWCPHPDQRPHRRPHVKCFGKCSSLGISIFLYFLLHLSLFIILIKPLTTKAHTHVILSDTICLIVISVSAKSLDDIPCWFIPGVVCGASPMYSVHWWVLLLKLVKVSILI